MAFIEKEDPVVLNIMLTSKGREQLSAGALTFSYFVVGDSEIDYNFIRNVNMDIDPDFNSFESNILRPRDKNAQIISFIPRNATGTTSGDSFNALSTISPITYEVVNKQATLGFFTNNATTFIADALHVKQPDVMIDMATIVGGHTLSLLKSPTYAASVLEPAVNDLIYVRWAFNNDTTPYLIDKNKPTPYLMYQITGITSGSLGGNNLIVEVDRELPDFTNFAPTGKSGALIYYSGITKLHQYATDYLSESVLNFLQNYQCGIENFPFWNMSIIFTEEIAGVQAADRKFGQFNTRGYGGFVSYIQNQAPLHKKLGVIHYTNNSPANTYGEEFYNDTPTLDIPTIMWHKSNTTTLGTTLKASGTTKLLTGSTKSLNIDYYDLCDPIGNIVGKVFNGLKLFVIEDQELLFAMSYKSNRSWTLPNYIVGNGGSPCDDTIITIPLPPEITLVGLSTVTMTQYGSYVDMGATAYDSLDGDITANIVTTGSVNTLVVGTYYIYYNVTNSNGISATQVIRTVIVNPPPPPPVITLIGSSTVTMTQYGTYVDMGATAFDSIDGDITANIVTTGSVNALVVGTYYIYYNVTNSSGIPAAQVIRTVIVNPPASIPVITLIGSSTITIVQNNSYTEFGATAFDSIDGNITSSIGVSGTINTSTLGTQYRYYNVTNSSGVPAVQVIRTIIIIPASAVVACMYGNADYASPPNYPPIVLTATGNYTEACLTELGAAVCGTAALSSICFVNAGYKATVYDNGFPSTNVDFGGQSFVIRNTCPHNENFNYYCFPDATVINDKIRSLCISVL